MYDTEQIALADDSVVELKPLNLALLKKFMSKMKEWSESEDPDETFELLMQAGAICFAKIKPEFWDKDNNTYTEQFEEVMDLKTLYKVLDVCGGVKLDDPKLLEAAQAALLAEVATGTQ